jgi:hypothetical protein
MTIKNPSSLRGIAWLETLDCSVWFIAPSGRIAQERAEKRQGSEEKCPFR